MKKLLFFLFNLCVYFGVKSQDNFHPTPGDTIIEYSFEYLHEDSFLFIVKLQSVSSFNEKYQEQNIINEKNDLFMEGFYMRGSVTAFGQLIDTFYFALNNLPVEKNVSYFYRAHDFHGPDNIKVDSLFLRVRFEEDNTATVLGINAYELADAKIFPNPVGETLFLDAVTNADIKIFEQNGKLVLNENVANGRVEVGHLKSGLYYLQVGNVNSLKKFVKK